MDKLAEQLRADADRLDASVSPELERRIEAGLHSTQRSEAARPPRTAPTSFWWASVTGVAATLGLIVILNWPQATTVEPVPAIAAAPTELPTLEWKTEAAVLVRPLELEWEALKNDLETAEQVVRDDIDALLN